LYYSTCQKSLVKSLFFRLFFSVVKNTIVKKVRKPSVSVKNNYVNLFVCHSGNRMHFYPVENSVESVENFYLTGFSWRFSNS